MQINQLNELEYLEINEDVKEAIESGKFQDVKHHLEISGLKEIEGGSRKFHKDFEVFDEEQYLHVHEDVAIALKKGTFKSGFEHFCLFGYKEIINKNRQWFSTINKGQSLELEVKKEKLIVVVGIPRSGLTLLMAILDSHPEIVSWFLPLSSRRHASPKPFKNMNDLKKQYNKTYPEYQINKKCTWVISETTSHEGNLEWLNQSINNIAKDNSMDIEIIWMVRSLRHIYISQYDASKRYWGEKDLKINVKGYRQYIDFVKKSYADLHSFVYHHTYTLLSYEALTKNPDTVIDRLMENLGFQSELSQKEYYKHFPYYKACGDPSICEQAEKITFSRVLKREDQWILYSFINGQLDHDRFEFYKEFEKFSNHIQFRQVLSKNEYKNWLFNNIFEPEYYLLNNDDVMESNIDPNEHYLIYGWKEYRQPTSWFNSKAYLNKNTDVKGEPLSHYLLYGRFNNARLSEDQVGKYDKLILIDPETYKITPDLMLEAPYYDNPTVSIIIPAYNQGKYTLACIESIIKNTEDDIAYEIIVMDDNSTEISARELGKYMKNIIFHSNEQNQGFLRNCNIGTKYAKGEYLLFLNNDTNVQPGWLSSLVELIDPSNKIGMVGSKLVYSNGLLQEAGGIVWSDASAWNYGRLGDPKKPEYNYVRETDYLTGAAMMIWKPLWDKIGGFDDIYVPAYYEDTDLAFEVRKLGYKTLYQPKSVVVHFEGISNGTDLSSGVKRYQTVNRKTFYNKWKNTLIKDQFPDGKDLFLARDHSQKKKHMLFVDHYLPHFDQDAGSKATFQYLQIFAKNNIQVHFIGDNFYDYPDTPYLEALTQKGIEVLYGNWYANFWKEWFIENSKYFSYVVLSRPHISKKYIDIIRSVCDVKIIYFGHDLHFLREHRQFNIKKEEKYLQSSKEWKEVELELIQKADVSYFFSDVEKEEVLKIDSKASVEVVPLYIYDKFTRREKYSKERKDIMFVGGFGHAPNVDAVIWFVENVWPLIEDTIEDIHFYIIGSRPTDEIVALGKHNITVTGFIDDEELNKYYNNCRVVVAPLRFGAGVKGKIVDALYNGMPVVTTSIGAEGLINMEDILLIADESKEFAEKVLMLYQNNTLADTYAERGLEYCKKYFSEERAKEKMPDIFKEIQ